uniref:Uncharacterized protein n=1 Tax=Rhizophora mucronata TaxID=61149 RepID=A0A2P2JSG4_RHIMU
MQDPGKDAQIGSPASFLLYSRFLNFKVSTQILFSWLPHPFCCYLFCLLLSTLHHTAFLLIDPPEPTFFNLTPCADENP